MYAYICMYVYIYIYILKLYYKLNNDKSNRQHAKTSSKQASPARSCPCLTTPRSPAIWPCWSAARSEFKERYIQQKRNNKKVMYRK